jgi:hypothetical protein
VSERTRITPAPSDEEVVAIMAAHEALWPKPVAEQKGQPHRESPWRFSGRWWSKPIPVRRNRPWL